MTVETQGQPLIDHLIELRNRLLKSMAAIAFIFIALVYFSDKIYEFVSSPLIAQLPAGASMIATNVTSPLFAPLKLTMLVSVFIAMPLVLYQLWSFIAPALYKHERRLVLPLMASSSFLFYCGVAFAYYVVFPLVFQFFTSISLSDVQFATDIASYLDFVLALFFAFGIAFEVPVAIILLCWTGATDPKTLASKRAYVLVSAFIIGMLLTPPDIISQTLLAIPMYLLFEVGVFFARFYADPEDVMNVNAEQEPCS